MTFGSPKLDEGVCHAGESVVASRRAGVNVVDVPLAIGIGLHDTAVYKFADG